MQAGNRHSVLSETKAAKENKLLGCKVLFGALMLNIGSDCWTNFRIESFFLEIAKIAMNSHSSWTQLTPAAEAQV